MEIHKQVVDGSERSMAVPAGYELFLLHQTDMTHHTSPEDGAVASDAVPGR